MVPLAQRIQVLDVYMLRFLPHKTAGPLLPLTSSPEFILTLIFTFLLQ